jgi:hypothetical protein
LSEYQPHSLEESDRGQWTLLPECLDDFIDESNPVRVIVNKPDPPLGPIPTLLRQIVETRPWSSGSWNESD